MPFFWVFTCKVFSRLRLDSAKEERCGFEPTAFKKKPPRMGVS